MKILIGQPHQEETINQLTKEIQSNPTVDIFLYPEGYLADEEVLESACMCAKGYGKIIITGYKGNGKNRAIIINQHGEKSLDRAKTPVGEELYEPLSASINGLKIGYLLCMELLKGYDGLDKMEHEIDFIAHPIGVGMYSEEQFEEWISVAKHIAKMHNTMVIGTSHADGRFADYDVSLPISYCIDKTGQPIYISKSDTRTRIVDLVQKEVHII